MKRTLFLILSLVAFSACAESAWKLAGSTTVASVLEPYQSRLEAGTAHKLLIEPTSSTHGLEALAKGKADIAMISSPLEEIANNANQKRPGAIIVEEYRASSIGSVKLRFVVNPRNPVRKLSPQELADLLTGKITNWSNVGGLDSPILLVSLPSAGSLVREKVMHGAQFRTDGRTVNSADQISTIVAQNPAAIGIISEAHKRGLTSFLDVDVDISAPLFLVTKGEPSAEQAKLFAAVKGMTAPAH